MALTTSKPIKHRPLLGAEIITDVTATPERIDHWFELLSRYQMPLARVFIPRTESQLEKMDLFFDAAEKYGVVISATLGGLPSEENANWIRRVVKRYMTRPALDSWILMNEPGVVPHPDEFATPRFRAWLKEKYKTIDVLNLAWRTCHESFDIITPDDDQLAGSGFSPATPFVDWNTFWREHLGWHLNWIADVVHELDRVHPVHTNPHALAGNLAPVSLDLPSWRPFLDSLGCSMHPSWHFPLLGRDQYTFGVSYVCDMVRGAIEPKPFWITELQGGNTTYSGGRPLYPFPADLAQWLWTGIGAGIERAIFWLLNNRSASGESGEWSLLDFQQQPTERLDAAHDVARTINRHGELFDIAQPAKYPITIGLSLETMTLQQRYQQVMPTQVKESGQSNFSAARSRDAHTYAVYGAYRALQELGYCPQIKHMHDLPTEVEAGPDAGRGLLVLPNITALSASQAESVTRLVHAGHTALITGLTGVWDPNGRFMPLLEGFPLEQLIGATLRDIRTLDEDCQVQLQHPALTLPSELWVGEIRNHTANVIGSQNGWITAVHATAGKGQVFWIPSLVDVAGWLGDGQALSKLMDYVMGRSKVLVPFRFAHRQPGCLLRVMRCNPESPGPQSDVRNTTGSQYITIIANGTNKPCAVDLVHPPELRPQLLWPEESDQVPFNWTLPARGTLVVHWS